MTSTPRPARQLWEDSPVAAEHYERGLVSAFFEAWAQDLVERMDPQPGERVLDLGCGTGIVARIVAARVGPSAAITGVDINADMLAVARHVSAAVHPSIEWRQASALDTGLSDRFFDVAFCQQGMQFFPDPQAAVHELYRVLAPGGRVAVSVWCDPESPGYVPIRSALEHHLSGSPEAAGFVRAIFGLSDATELRGLLTAAGFHAVQITRRTQVVRFPSPEAWVQTFLAAAPVPGIARLGDGLRNDIIGDAAARLRHDVDDDEFTFPMEANIATARRLDTG